MPDVSERSLKRVVEEEGLDWNETLHVAATSSLAKAMRRASAPAVSIANLLDIVVWAGMPGDRSMPIGQFPCLRLVGDRGSEEFNVLYDSWSSELAGRNLGLGVHADLRLRRFLDRSAPDIGAGRLLRRSVRDLRKGIQSVATAGFMPDDFDDSEPIPKVALAAWRHLERESPELFALRDDAWTEPSSFAKGGTPVAVDLRRRIDSTFTQLLGTDSDRRRVIYHGFYFFTPHQWAWFQLLRHHGTVDQYFVVHDDGKGRAFETWRRYFVDRWQMPTPEPKDCVVGESRSGLLSAALTGSQVPTSESLPIRLVECKSSTEFIGMWRLQRSDTVVQGRPSPQLFAAGAADIDRILKRLDYDPNTGRVDLAELPVGQFLLALHGCIEPRTGGEHRLVLSHSRVIDMVASRLLDVGDAERDPSIHVAAFERAAPFFSDCATLQEWVDRAKVLERLVISDVAKFGERRPGLTDKQRIAVAAHNPLRLVPWADLSNIEASVIWETISRIAELVEQVTSVEERDNPDKYLGWIRQQLARGMANLPEDERKTVEDKLRGVTIAGDGDFDVEGIIDVVHMLLGRQAEFGFDGEESSDSPIASQLRNLDALGFTPSEVDLHIANLVDTEFPNRFQSFPWPFTNRLLKSDVEGSTVSVEIFQTREETAALSDLYLFWLALAGVMPTASVTLSWITELGSEIRNPSSLVMLIAKLDHRSSILTDAVGGLRVERADQVGDRQVDRGLPDLRKSVHTEEEIKKAIAAIDRLATSSMYACPRRFAIQWAMGPSASFQTPHTQRMLFGNVQGALQKNWNWKLDEKRAVQVTKDMWRQFTRGERLSSYVKRVVQPSNGAFWQWIYSLGGNNHDQRPQSVAYRVAVNGPSVADEVEVPEGSVLPIPNDIVNDDVCNMCPVKPRCALQSSLREGMPDHA